MDYVLGDRQQSMGLDVAHRRSCRLNFSNAFFGGFPPSPPAVNAFQRAAIMLHELSHYYHGTGEKEAWLLHNCFMYFYWRGVGQEDMDPQFRWWPKDTHQPRQWPKNSNAAKKSPDPRQCLCAKYDSGIWVKMARP